MTSRDCGCGARALFGPSMPPPPRMEYIVFGSSEGDVILPSMDEALAFAGAHGGMPRAKVIVPARAS